MKNFKTYQKALLLYKLIEKERFPYFLKDQVLRAASIQDGDVNNDGLRRNLNFWIFFMVKTYFSLDRVQTRQ